VTAAVEPYATGMLDVGDGHSLYWETCGNPEGKPAVMLHGGPGAGCTPGMRRAFDPDRYRVVLFDQRNSGRSTPYAGDPEVDLSANTTPHLVADLERLREHLGIDRWLVWGGSWGTTLAFAYAEAFPERVTEMVLVAITTGSRREVEWMTRDMGRVFPREWERFRDGVPEADRAGSLPAAYSRLLHDRNPAVRARAAQDWCDWEDTHVSLAPDHFLPEGRLLADAGRLAGIPGVMVHGRLDVSGPLDTAWQMHRAWPGSELVVVGDAGHSSSSLGPAIGTAIERFADRRGKAR
jgi:proline iminopeptidase